MRLLLAHLLNELPQLAVVLHLAPEVLFACLLCGLHRATLLAQTSLALEALFLKRSLGFLTTISTFNPVQLNFRLNIAAKRTCSLVFASSSSTTIVESTLRPVETSDM